MKKFKSSIVTVLLAAMLTTVFTPAVPAYAFSLTDLIAPTAAADKTSSGSSVFDLLLGLLLGKFLGNIFNTSDAAPGTSTLGKALGLSDKTEASVTGSAVIATAQRYMGVPYVWGGDTPAGFDCSGFTQYVLKQHGIAIPRTAAEQFAAGMPVDKANLKIGDLVFFTTYKPGASHVGFYMGDGKFIHASSVANKVTISALDEQYYTERYIGARRYLP
ncbi:C40 family peptidase [Sporolituus thermophilus]|uniref:NlpC/P60 family protein n=1 Tax=Sporolituus thermophilus DSM 23256 TaxID=1123285 RepID=A0A1G7K7D5_9FIRM|nr:C40 family peptidase [Sporolituus thermophilus]SDF33082.1 NlpC/P60 family protein [Sporolituus thermophilus DSM 23256]